MQGYSTQTSGRASREERAISDTSARYETPAEGLRKLAEIQEVIMQATYNRHMHRDRWGYHIGWLLPVYA